LYDLLHVRMADCDVYTGSGVPADDFLAHFNDYMMLTMTKHLPMPQPKPAPAEVPAVGVAAAAGTAAGVAAAAGTAAGVAAGAVSGDNTKPALAAGAQPGG